MKHYRIQRVLNLSLCLIFIFSLAGVPPVQAGTRLPPALISPQSQGTSDTSPTPPPPPGARLGYNSVTGRLNFVGGDAADPLASAGELSAMGVRSAADGVLAQYAPDFGVQNPAKDLRLARTAQDEQGSVMRYQQQYQGIPILGGELIVNADSQGQVLSLNGEVSPDLALQTTTPAVSSEAALQKAVAGAKGWYGLDPDQINPSQPALWIYDPRILQEDSNEPVSLVWRIEVKSYQGAHPVNELVLVDAANGEISLHFSQAGNFAAPPDDLAGESPTPEQVSTETPSPEPTLSPTPETGLTQESAETPTDIPTLAPTQTAMPAPAHPPENELQAQSGVTWYVAPPPAGNDSNDCAAPATPCVTINAALAKASDGDVIDIAVGTYTGSGAEVVKILKNVNLYGGWNSDFTAQDGFSIIDGQNQRRVVVVGIGNGSISQPALTSTLSRLVIFQGNQNHVTYGSGLFGDAGSSVTLQNSIVSHNAADNGDGYAISIHQAKSFTLINSIVDGNAGGIGLGYVQQVVINNATIVNNHWGQYGMTGGLYIYPQPASLTIKNTIIANNSGYYNDCLIHGITLSSSSGHNLIRDPNNCYTASLPGDIIGQDPLIGGWFAPGYYPLLPGSPAIDAGSPDVPGSGGMACEQKDLFGTARPIDGNHDGKAVCDIGAYETPPPAPRAAHRMETVGNSSFLTLINTDYKNFSVKIFDQYETPLANVSVTFSAPISGPTGKFQSSNNAQAVVFSGGDGVATAPTFTANNTVGTFAVSASVNGISDPAIFQMENYYDDPGSITIVGGDKQKIGPGNVFLSNLNVVVKDLHDRPMTGTHVIFTSPETGASATFAGNGSHTSTVMTDTNGTASITAAANGISGTYSVTATVEGTTLSVNFTLTNIILYVSANGNDGATGAPNDCSSPIAPCKTIVHALSTMSNGHFAMRLAGGTFSERITISYDYINLSGGWNEDFSAQNSRTVFQNNSGSSTDIVVGSNHVQISNLSFENSYRGIYSSSGVSDILLRNVVFLNNQIGIENMSLDTTIINATFSKNTTAILSDHSPTPVLHLKNITAVGNHIGLATEGWDTGATPFLITIQNSILAANDINCQLSSPATVNSEGYNIWGTSPGCTGTGGFNITDSDQIGVDPMLSSLIDNHHYALLPGSPAIDAINGTDTFCPPDDIRSVSRPVGAGCDIGAYEYEDPVSPYQLAVYSGANQIMVAGRPLAFPLQAILVDLYGTPVQGVAVTFSAPIAGPSGIFKNTGNSTISAMTDSSGVATVDGFITNALVGDNHVSVSAPGATNQADFPFTNAGISVYLDGVYGNDANDCLTPASPCKSLNIAVSRLKPWEVLAITANNQYVPDFHPTTITQFFISGGWDTTFEHQIGQTILNTGYLCNSGGVNIGLNSYIYFDRVDIQANSVSNLGTLIFNDGAITHNPYGIQNQGTLIMTNATVADNSLDDCPGGGFSIYPAVSNKGGSILLTNVTVTANVLFYEESETIDNAGMGINNYSGSVRIQNTLVTHNRSVFGYDLSGEITSLGHNLIGVINGSQFIPAEGDMYGTAGWLQKTGVNAPADNGGGTITAALLPGSPAIGAGDPAACPVTDQRGALRPVGVACSIGAFEGSLTVTDPLPSIRIYANEGGNYDRMGPLICKTPSPNCTNGRNLAADNIYQIITDMHAFLWDHYQRISLDNDAMPIYAFINMEEETTDWDGDYLYVNQSSPIADDVVGHELIHGVIRSEANLFNYYQSGSIAESLGDLWGEYLDQTNGHGNDSDQVRWLIGEDDTKTTDHRSMKDPYVDSMTSTHYSISRDDNGSVHINSGVNDKAVYLMVDGGTFNGKTVLPLGWEKIGAIYYYTLTHLLTSGSDYADLYLDLDQACRALVGGDTGITLADCQQARNATDAVFMNKAFSSDPPDTCPAGTSKNPTKLFFDDFENGAGQWQFGAYQGNPRWGLAYGYAASGEYSLYGNDFDENIDGNQLSDTYASMKNDVTVPSGVKTYLFYRHSYGFEYYIYNHDTYSFDGGIVEYTTNGGLTWTNASSLFYKGKNYSGTLYKTNPLSGRSAYTTTSQGYVATSYNLSELAGKPIRFRWRMATDSTGSYLGWIVDDVEIFTCEGNPGVPSLKSPANATLTSSYRPKLDWGDASAANHYQLQLSTDPGFGSYILNLPNVPVSEYTLTADLDANTTFYWRVLNINSNDVASKWSSVFSFRTPLPSPDLTGPPNLSTVSNLRPTFQWGLVIGATDYFIQISTSPTFSSTIINTSVTPTFFTPPSNLAANKPLYWHVKAKGNNPSNWSNTFTFTIASPPTIPHLTSPADKSIVDSLTPRMDWTDVTSPPGILYDFYLLQIASDNAFSNRLPDIKVNGLANSQKILDDALLPNHTYYWRVSAGNNLGQSSDWSSAASFRTSLPIPGLIVPADHTTLLTTRPAFDWNDVPGATSYAFQLSTSPAFTSTVVNISLTASLYTFTSDISRDKDFYWHVQAKGANPSAWSATYTFHSANPPGIPIPFAPANSSILLNNPPILQWSAIYGADHYQLQVASSSSFSGASLLYFGAAFPSMFPPSASLPDLLTPNRTIYWRVRSLNPSNQYSLWSSAFSFHTRLPAPILLEPRPDEGTLPQRPTFSWEAVSDATGYIIQLTQYDPTFPNTVINKTIKTTTFTVSSNFPLGSYYFWRVKALGTYPSPWSEVRRFTIKYH
jgi:Zn-dependent metalloprotease